MHLAVEFTDTDGLSPTSEPYPLDVLGIVSLKTRSICLWRQGDMGHFGFMTVRSLINTGTAHGSIWLATESVLDGYRWLIVKPNLSGGACKLDTLHESAGYSAG